MFPEVNTFENGEDFRTGTVLLVDKPLGWTSFDVVNKLRYTIRKQFNFKKLKVGHAGTLDPLATGLLIICTGKMTKQINAFMADNKVYTGQLKLGATTPSYDGETEEDAHFAFDHIDEELIQQEMHKMCGSLEQAPPVFSAKRVDGKKAYKLARKGEVVEMKKSLVRIQSFDSTKVELPLVDFCVLCSKGTYIRSLAHDLGKNLNSGAYLTGLRRESSGPFQVTDALSVEALTERIMGMEE